MNRKADARQITITALSIAIVCVATMVIQIPIPLGYMHLGNCCILLISFYFSKSVGMLAGGVGSAMADLLSGYPQWILPTLLIKSVMGFVIALLSKDHEGKSKMTSLRTLLAAGTGIAVMIVGYTVAGTILYGSIAAGVAQVPGLSVEGILGILLFYVAGFAFETAGIPKLFHQNA